MSEENKDLGDMAEDAMDNAQEGAENLGGKAEDALDSAAEKASDIGEKASEKFDDAKALIDAVDTSSSFASAFAEVRGDMLLASQDYSAAVDAYQSAQTIADAQQMQASPTLSTKLAYAKGFL